MSKTFLEQAQEHAAQSSEKAEQMKEAVSKGLEDFVHKSRHTLKRGRRAAEDYAHRVKKYPLSSVTGGVITGLVIGMLLGWMIGRRSGHHLHKGDR